MLCASGEKLLALAIIKKTNKVWILHSYLLDSLHGRLHASPRQISCFTRINNVPFINKLDHRSYGTYKARFAWNRVFFFVILLGLDLILERFQAVGLNQVLS